MNSHLFTLWIHFSNILLLFFQLNHGSRLPRHDFCIHNSFCYTNMSLDFYIKLHSVQKMKVRNSSRGCTFLCRLGHSNLITCLTSFFWKRNPVRLQKKRKKSHLWCLTDESGFEIFCQTQKKKKKKWKF